MLILITAVVTASVLGSIHCVGMCGPLAIWASGTGQTSRRQTLATATTLYHLGRLVTYAAVGFIAGSLGQLVDIGGEALGVQLVAARIAGTLMIGAGGLRLWQLWRASHRSHTSQVAPLRPSWISGLLVRLRPVVFRLPISARGFATGLLTAFLPCGWLYLFALLAAGTGSYVMGTLVMAAFWLGSVPALVGLVAGSAVLANRFSTLVPVATALLLIVGGFYTAAGRGFANLQSLADIRPTSSSLNSAPPTIAGTTTPSQTLANRIDELISTPLPCCAEETTGGKP